jgi:protein-tyrosine phosphatase
MINVLFVCLGNICRSPMADGVFQDMVNKAGLGDKILVDSAGTGSWHIGEKAHSGTRRVLAKHGIDYDGRARQLGRGDFSRFDYILAMDYDNLSDIKRLAGNSDAEIRMFLSYAKEAGETNVDEVPDPYYSGRFDEVYELVAKGSTALLNHIRKAHNL